VGKDFPKNYVEFISAASSRKMMLTKEKLDAAFGMIDRVISLSCNKVIKN